ncbi:MAG: 6-carboxytetrahydropterin synthase [Alphaproteobacteria bacterium]|nr:6-carboxytetrahydropterin synthase [Alphaproteobacteria bacterium]
MFALSVRDHIMIAHSFQGAVFGPAQRLHGATFVVDATFFTRELDGDGLIVDIGRASEVLRQVLAPLNYRNLDDVVEFRGRNTTTEALAKHVFDQLAGAVRAGRVGRPAAEVAALRVALAESHVARAWYEAPLGPA